MSKKPIISTQNLTIGYFSKKELKIAENLEVSIFQGDLVALVGGNGIGKSTLLRTLTGIQKPIDGKVMIQGQNLHELAADEVAKLVSVVLTDKLPPSNLSVYELIAMGRHPYTNWLGILSKDDQKAIENAIDWTQTQHLLHKKHYEISDGQLQIVMIARALAQNTPVIVLDEPTTHLDLPHKVALFKLLKKLAQEVNKAILFSTHDIDLAIQLADQMMVMTAGKIVQNDPCQLITQGVFDTLFKDENIYFDASKGKYSIQ
jgi:iron complex transport system ATP-binding protein